MRALMVALFALAACAPEAPPASMDADEVVSPNMTVAEWSASPASARATYFRGAVGAHITDPAQNETQRQFDDDLALDLRDCVDAEIENATPGPRDPCAPVHQCLP